MRQIGIVIGFIFVCLLVTAAVILDGVRLGFEIERDRRREQQIVEIRNEIRPVVERFQKPWWQRLRDNRHDRTR